MANTTASRRAAPTPAVIPFDKLTSLLQAATTLTLLWLLHLHNLILQAENSLKLQVSQNLFPSLHSLLYREKLFSFQLQYIPNLFTTDQFVVYTNEVGVCVNKTAHVFCLELQFWEEHTYENRQQMTLRTSTQDIGSCHSSFTWWSFSVLLGYFAVHCSAVGNPDGIRQGNEMLFSQEPLDRKTWQLKLKTWAEQQSSSVKLFKTHSKTVLLMLAHRSLGSSLSRPCPVLHWSNRPGQCLHSATLMWCVDWSWWQGTHNSTSLR